MKRLISLFAMLSCMAVGFAQSALVATLNHGESVSVFYGASALSEAYEAATHGDVITLSNGTFNSVNIAKNITVRGAGMDVVGSCTKIEGDIWLYGVPDSVDATGHLTLEGLYHDGSIYYGTKDSTYTSPLKNAHFVKCRLNSITSKISSNSKADPVLKNAVFLQCRIKGGLSVNTNSYAYCINCVVYGPSASSAKTTRFEFVNCLVKGYASSWDYSLFNNCILWERNYSVSLSSTCMVNNCLGINDGGYNIFKNIYPANIYETIKTDSISTIFKTFNGTYSDTETFELTDEAKAKYLGTDGTEVGIYGGTMPFSTKSSLPKIKKFNVASKSTEEGKLNVQIEVSGVE